MRRTLPLLLVLLLACPEPEPTPVIPDLPTGGCGLAAYDWLPLEQVGEVVFHQAEDEWSMGAGGLDILLEGAGISQFSPLPYDVKAWKVRYVTQDRGELVEATMLLTLPDVGDGSSFPIVVWPHGTSGFTDECAPTAGELEDNAFGLVFAAMGYAVVSPDYLGMNGFGAPAGFLHPYLVSEATAVATLDAVRALLSLQEAEDLGARGDPAHTVLWGGSEGGFAVLQAERYAARYLPEITIEATVALVPPTDLTGIAYAALAETIDATGGLAGAWIGQNSWFGAGDLSEVLLEPIAAALPGEMMESCGSFPSIEGVETMDQLFQPAVIDAAAAGTLEQLEPWGCYLRQADLASSVIPREVDPPVLVVLSEADQLVVTDPVRASLPILCDQGYDIEHLECAGADHTEGATSSLPYQIDWVADRLAGVPLEGTCVINAPIDCAQFLD